MEHAVRDLLVAWHDLVLGGRCEVCSAPGPALCRTCGPAVRPRPFPAWPTPTPPGLVLPVAAAEYAGPVRDLVIAHKERHRLSLAAPLGELLAAAVVHLIGGPGPAPGSISGQGDPVLLVPVPSHPSVVRARRHDPLLRTAREAAAHLRGGGVPARVDRRLVVARRPGDQAGLDARSRATNVQGSMRARPRSSGPADRLVVVDDVVTTGSTLREAQRALEASGTTVLGAATVAATRRLRPSIRTDPDRSGQK